MKSFIVNWRTSADGLSNGSPEMNGEPSLTVPDMCIPLEQLFARYVRVNGALPSMFGHNDTLPVGVENLDQMERADLLRSTNENIADLQSNLHSVAAKRAHDKRMKEQEEEEERWRAAEAVHQAEIDSKKS